MSLTIKYTFKVVLHSRHSPRQALFRADLRTNQSSAISIPQSDVNGVNYADEALEIPSEFRAADVFHSAALVSSNAEIPATGFR